MDVSSQLIGLKFTTFIPMPMLVWNDGENTKQMLNVPVRTLWIVKISYVSCIWIWQSRALNHSLAAVPRRFYVEINLKLTGFDRQKRHVRWLFMPRRYRAVVRLTVTTWETAMAKSRREFRVPHHNNILFAGRRLTPLRWLKTRRYFIRIDVKYNSDLRTRFEIIWFTKSAINFVAILRILMP